MPTLVYSMVPSTAVRNMESGAISTKMVTSTLAISTMELLQVKALRLWLTALFTRGNSF